jgi:hydrogenase maturation protein HypF
LGGKLLLLKRLELLVTGRVQGVGFRPFIYKLAQRCELTGWVYNTPQGASIEIQGERSNLRRFLNSLKTDCPPPVKLVGVKPRWLTPLACERQFAIRTSQTAGPASVRLSPDLASCDQCLQEVFDAANRRYRYPFTNCTNCGPRFTIVKALPYDRQVTTMDGFTMCPACRQEYDNPADRRFHAQPNACPQCGPQLQLLVPGPESGQLQPATTVGDPIAKTVAAVSAGNMVIIKGLGGFHLAADATQASAVQMVRRLKNRAAKPFAVMCRDLEQARAICEVSPAEATLLTSVIRPIVILRKIAEPTVKIVAGVAPGQDSVGVMLPYTPLHHLLLQAASHPWVMTSANLGDQPIAITEAELAPEIVREVAVVLTHNRPIMARADDSVVIAAPELILLRRSRGYVPEPVLIPKMREALGVGADFKNTACLIRRDTAYFTQHIGNLEDEAGERAAAQATRHLQTMFGLKPEVVGCDLHPAYRSRAFAGTLGLPLVAIQHHHAHILACMAENQLTGSVLGVAFDGTGYGTDGTVWGGEFLVADYRNFTRVASLTPLGLPGAERAVREPWRMAVAYLAQAFGRDWPEFPGLNRFTELGAEWLLPLLEQRVNTPLTTSAGRLFDAVAALVGLAPVADYEGEAAMALEGLARRSLGMKLAPYPVTVGDAAIMQLDFRAMVRAVVGDLRAQKSVGEIALRFHLTVVEGILQVCQRLRPLTGLNRVVLSGGVFQNALLLMLTVQRLEQQGFQVWRHRLIPPNDGGIALGQAVGAASLLE